MEWIIGIYLVIGAVLAGFLLSYLGPPQIWKKVLFFLMVLVLWPALIPVVIYLIRTLP